jgi:hypothetical protein
MSFSGIFNYSTGSRISYSSPSNNADNVADDVNSSSGTSYDNRAPAPGSSSSLSAAPTSSSSTVVSAIVPVAVPVLGVLAPATSELTFDDSVLAVGKIHSKEDHQTVLSNASTRPVKKSDARDVLANKVLRSNRLNLSAIGVNAGNSTTYFYEKNFSGSNVRRNANGKILLSARSAKFVFRCKGDERKPSEKEYCSFIVEAVGCDVKGEVVKVFQSSVDFVKVTKSTLIHSCDGRSKRTGKSISGGKAPPYTVLFASTLMKAQLKHALEPKWKPKAEYGSITSVTASTSQAAVKVNAW